MKRNKRNEEKQSKTERNQEDRGYISKKSKKTLDKPVLCVYNNQCCVKKRYKFPVIYELHAGRYQRLCGNFYDTILKRRSDYVNLYA